MSDSPTGEWRPSLLELGGLLLSDQTVDSLLDLIVVTAVSALPNVDGASVSLVLRHSDERLETVNATSEEMKAIDDVQYGEGGPCVNSIRTGAETRTEVPSGQWAAFDVAAVTAGIRHVWSLPLQPRDETIGALNLYSKRDDPWSEAATARTLARQAAAVLANAASLMSAELTNEQLREALESRDLIGQAKGILMVRESLDADGAFDVLRRASQDSNRKLREIAAEIVERENSLADRPIA